MSSSAHTSLYSSKVKIVTGLKDFLANQATPKAEISTLSFAIDPINLWQLLPYLDIAQKVFFSNREATIQYLGTKFLRIFTSSFALEQAQELIDENEELVVLGGQRFHPNKQPAPEWSELGSHFYVSPQFLIVKDHDEYFFKINIPKKTFERAADSVRLLLDLENFFSFKGHSSNVVAFQEQEQIPDFEVWEEQMSKALAAIDIKIVDKVVLSRKVIFSSDQSIKPDGLLEKLTIHPGEHFIFHLQWRSDRSFTSITPERLFSLEKGILASDAMAGTTTRSSDSIEDELLASKLKASSKDLEEHRFVSRAVTQTMEELGANEVDIDGEAESIVKLTHVQHLHTKIKGKLQGFTPISEILDSFHPTPAVGGTPKIDASEWLEVNESYDRGFYAAPLGVVHKHGADFCVAIRSALVHSHDLHVFAGAGIVSASEAKKEWQETAAKMKNFIFKSKPSRKTKNEQSYEPQPIA